MTAVAGRGDESGDLAQTGSGAADDRERAHLREWNRSNPPRHDAVQRAFGLIQPASATQGSRVRRESPLIQNRLEVVGGCCVAEPGEPMQLLGLAPAGAAN